VKSTERQVLQSAAHWLAQGRRSWLCTIVRTIGSSPRPVGSLLACGEDGEFVGSLSGGCVEEDLLQRIAAGDLAQQAPQRIEYGVTAEENERLGLPCGGRLEILVQSLAGRDRPWIERILEALDQRRVTRRSLDLGSGETILAEAPQYEPLRCDEQRLLQSFGPSQRLLLVGAGQLGECLAELAQAMDYEVLVTDPRERSLSQWAGPEVPRLPGMPDDAVMAHANDPHSIVITLTHDPRIDDMALMAALESQAWYVGALGSQRTTDKRLERLRQLGLPESAIARLHAPVGLPIGSKTPMEIAIAIIAELTQLRRAAERRE
jgi:xanthine dehydrogenase accessory factor